MEKIALLTCHNIDQTTDDHLLINTLRESGRYEVDNLPWDDEHDWKIYTKVLIRTTWDYTKRLDEFMKKLQFISQQTRLINSFEIVKWNHHKSYLKDLEDKGILIVPTVFFPFPGEVRVPKDWEAERFILKPCVSASAYNTMIVTKKDLESGAYKSKLFPTDWMLQPFMDEILQGEISLHFFSGKFSHGIIKVPKSGDFRVQEEYGGNIVPYSPSSELLGVAKNILDQVKEPLLFARVDVIPYKGSFALMELELIEPSLYFRKDPAAPQAFLEALDLY